MEKGRRLNVQRWESSCDGSDIGLEEATLVIDRLGVQNGATVADLAAGLGWLTLALADRVGAAGIVYAMDLSPEVVDIAGSNGLPEQIRPGRWMAKGLPLPEASLDLALLGFSLRRIGQPVAALREAWRALRPGGILAILEWSLVAPRPSLQVSERASVVLCEWRLDIAGFEGIRHQSIDDSLCLITGERTLDGRDLKTR